MSDTPHTDNQQTALWNGRAGCAWVNAQALLDQMLKPFEHLLVDAVCPEAGRRVLDVGCGTGGTTLAVARLLGANAQCTGADISEPMIVAAQARAQREATQASFICADVQRHAFDPASFDTIMSRFGVMFFDDPVVAFTNLRRAATDDARLHCIAWRGAADNPFMTTAERAAAPLLPNLPARRPGAPGQFAFADQNRVASILEASGWAAIEIRPVDVDCTLPESALVDYFSTLGPVGLILQDADGQTRKRVVGVVRRAFDPYVHGADVRFTAACWMISASAANPPR